MEINKLGITYFAKAYGLSKLILIWFFIVLICTIIYYLIKLCNNKITKNERLVFGYKFRVVMFFIISILFLLYLLIRYSGVVTSIVYLLIWSIVFAYLLNPFVNIISRRNISRGIATMIVFASIILVIVILALTVTPMITKQITDFMVLLPHYTEEFMEFVDGIYNSYIVSVNNLPKELLGFDIAVDSYMQEMQYKIIDTVKNITNKSLDFFSNILVIIMIPIFTFYFLKDAAYFRRKLLMIIPKGIRNHFISAGRDVNKVLNKYIRGQILIALIVGIVSVITLVIMGIDFALIVGMIAGLMNIIPYFGPIFGAIPAMLIALIDQPIKALWVAVAFFIIQQVESALIQPKISGESVNLHPVVILVALLIGSELFGILGLVFAVPIAGSLKIIVIHIKKIFVKI